MKTKAGKKVLLTLVCAALAIALGACSGDKAETGSSQITIGIPQDVDSLDPHKAVAAGTKEVLFNVFEGLVKPDSEGNLNDAVAESHTISEDGRVYTFTLREGVKFHDGTPVTAQDVKYSLDRCSAAEEGGPLVPAFSAIESVNIVDEKTVEVVLKEGDTEFLPYLTAAIIPEHNGTPESTPVGTGPYKYVSRSPQENVILEKFDGYWGTPANIETVRLQVVANADTIVTGLNGGSIDMFARVTQAQADQLSGDFEVLEGTMNLVQAMYLNNEKAPFDKKEVRQALCYAVDPQAVMDMISDGKGAQIGSSMFPAFEKYFMPELSDMYAVNLEKAKELLKEAGYENGFSFTIAVPSNYQQHIDTAQVLVEQLKKIGVTADINLIEWDSWLSDVYAERNYQATVVGVDASALTPSALLSRFVSTAGNNFINFNNADYDAAYAKALGTNVYIQDLPYLVALNKKYAGYEFYPLYVQDVSKLYIVEE